jgi:hypothetical protein
MLQEDAEIPDDAWEYQIRKALNDAAFNGLDYVPYCSTMPVQKKCEDPKFIWVRTLHVQSANEPLLPDAMTNYLPVAAQKKKGAH